MYVNALLFVCVCGVLVCVLYLHLILRWQQLSTKGYDSSYVKGKH